MQNIYKKCIDLRIVVCLSTSEVAVSPGIKNSGVGPFLRFKLWANTNMHLVLGSGVSPLNLGQKV
jgi:hypothetical protein